MIYSYFLSAAELNLLYHQYLQIKLPVNHIQSYFDIGF